jgi:hypothetical protein
MLLASGLATALLAACASDTTETSASESEGDDDRAKKHVDASADAKVTDASRDAKADAHVDANAPDASRDGAPADDASAARAAYGFPCTVGDDSTCQDGLFCLEGPTGSTGFCSKICLKTSNAACPGSPAGTAAFCVITDVDTKGDKACAFACLVGGKAFKCPGALTCETADDPPGSGQRMCIP